MQIKQILKDLSTEIDNRLFRVEDGLGNCPEGVLMKDFHGGKAYLMQETVKNKRRKRHSLSKDPKMVEALLRKAALLEEERLLRDALASINKIRKEISDFDSNDFIRRYSAKFDMLEEDVLLRALSDPKSSAWESAMYEYLTTYPEEKKHTTSRGLKVRSKSELLIAERLYDYNIPFRYEQVLSFGNGSSVAPDFTILGGDGNIYYWEHNGLTNDRHYLDRQQQKARLYETVGIVPWKNLIVTYDDENGSIDSRQIEAQITSRLL